MSQFESYVADYGYVALVLGGIVDAETFAVLGGFAVCAGVLRLPWVLVAMMLAGLCGDSIGVTLGRIMGRGRLLRSVSLSSKVARAESLLLRHQTPVILGLRFLWGLRAALAFAIGVSSVSMRRFVLLDAIGSGMWVTVMVMGTCLLGKAFGVVIDEAKPLATVAFIGGFGLVLAVVVVRSFVTRWWEKECEA